MKNLLSITLILWTTIGFSQSSLLFEITGNGLEKPSYLFGTMHVQDEAAYSWNDSVLWAIEQVDVAAFEIDMNGKELAKGIKPDEKTQKEWEDFIADDLAPAIEAIIDPDTLGARISGIYGQALGTLLKKDKNERGTFIDKFLQEYAQKMGKEIVAVESIQEQLNVVLSMDKSSIKKAIVDFIEADNWDIDLEVMMGAETRLVESYSTRSLTNVCNELNKQFETASSSMATDFYKKLFDDRNAIMFTRTDKMLKKQRMFVAVGAGHLCGITGLVEQYKKAGYTLRPIDIGAPTTKPVTWTTFDSEAYSVSIPTGVSNFTMDSDNYDYMGSLDGNPSASIYTSRGKAQFSIEFMYIAEEIEEAEDAEYYEYDAMESETDYYEEAVEDAPAEETFEYSEEYDEDQEMEEAEEYPIEEAYSETEYSEEVIEEREEYVYDQEIEEAEEYPVEDAYDEVAYADEMNVDFDADSDYENSKKKKKKKKKKDKGPKKLKDRMNEEYWGIVMKSVMTNAMSQMFKDAAKDVKDEKEVEEEAVETPALMITIMGKEYEVEVKDQRFMGYTYTVKIPTGDEGLYELVISGDRKLLDSHELNQFFSSFQLKQ